MSDSKYYIVGYRSQKFHTDPECRHVLNSELQEISKEQTERRHLTKCTTCDKGITNKGGSGGVSMLEKILQEQDKKVADD